MSKKPNSPTTNISASIGPSANSNNVSVGANGHIVWGQSDPHVFCKVCKKDGPLGISYNGPKLLREICQPCLYKSLDKLFGIENELEAVLYDK